MSKVTLSIIIVSFNTEKLTLACVDSIYKFPPGFSFEVIIVDNSSNDDTVAKLNKLNFENLKIIDSGSNLGFSKANNLGIKESRGEYKMLLNSDTLIINNVFDQLVKFASSHLDAGVVAPKLLNKDKSLQPSIFRLPNISRAIEQYWLNKKGVLDKYGLTTDKPTEVEAVVGAAFLITPEAFRKAGVLNEKYFMYFEDLDYCEKVRGVGLKVYYVPDARLIHLHGASGNGEVNSYLVNSSKIYFGKVRYYLYTFILWSGQKIQKLF